MKDNCGRTVDYLRLSVTDNCNLRCRYCVPEGEFACPHDNHLLAYDDYLKIVRAAVELGVKKVRVTGGEPLVRNGLPEFLHRLTAISQIEDVSLTTNGILLEKYAEQLKSAGVKRLNVSLDSLNEEKFAEITRGGSLAKVLAGLEKADQLGFKIKLNMVAMRGINDQELVDFAALSRHKPWSVRFIEYMPMVPEGDYQAHFISGHEILALLREQFEITNISTGEYAGPAKPYKIADAAGSLGIITPMSEHFCSSCNRIRITSQGAAKSCLFSPVTTDLKPTLNDHAALKMTLEAVISGKPSQHDMRVDSQSVTGLGMSAIGG